MKEKNKISDFFASKNECIVKNSILTENDRELINIIVQNQIDYPNIYGFLKNPSKFCEESFPVLIQKIKREKRFLNFQTPNRIEITHEYTLLNTNGKDRLKTDYYYLFTPSKRLDWLKINYAGEDVAIADSSFVKNKLKTIFQKELLEICKILSSPEKNIIHDPNKVLDFIYNCPKCPPCFVEIRDNMAKPQQLSDILIIQFFESIQPQTENTTQLINFLKKTISPLTEKEIVYSYRPISKNANSWLYLKAPEKFELYSKPDTNSNVETSMSRDPEISSHVIKMGANDDFKTYHFVIDINLPQSLRRWYFFLYWTTFISLLYVTAFIIDKCDIFSRFTLTRSLCITENWLVDKIYQPRDIITLNLAIIAIISATRGWLIVEETILKTLTIRLTVMMFVLSFLSVLLLYI